MMVDYFDSYGFFFSILKGDYKKALDEGQVLVAYARIMFVGTGGVGKSSLLHGLMNKKLPAVANSTQVADLLAVKPQNLKAVGDESNPWVEVTDDDEINELVGLVLLVSNVAKGLTQSSRFVQLMQGAAAALTDSSRFVQLVQGAAAVLIASRLRSNKSNVCEEYRQQVGRVKNEVVREVLSRAIELAQKNPHAQAPELEVLMRVWDCGGQSVYLDIVSAFLTPKTLTMLLYDAREDLHNRCVSLSHRNGVVTQSQQQNSSYLDVLMQWMAAIYEMSTDKKSGSIPEYPRIITIGTHGDDPKVSANKESIVSKVSAECEGKAFTHIIGKGFIVNNKSAGGGSNEDPTFKEIRKEVLDFATQSSVKIATPVTWVLFRKVLEEVAKTQPVLTYDEAVEMLFLVRSHQAS